MNKNMTKEQMLASLEAQIRKDIPRLMELREGCIIKHNRFDWIRKIVYKKENTLITIDDPHQDKEVFSYKYKNDFAEEEYTIIGHDIMLNDVLEWLEIKTGCDISKGRYAVLPNGEFIFIEYEQQEGFDIVKTFINSNLSSPYLKDQSEELIKLLYNIVKDE